MRDAEFGDVATIGNDMILFAIDGDGMITGWNINEHKSQSVVEFSSGTGELALYRSVNANRAGGPTKNEIIIGFGEMTSTEIELHSGSRHYIRIIGGYNNIKPYVSLPYAWHIGHNNTYVDVDSCFAGFNPGLDDIFDVGFLAYGTRRIMKEIGKRLSVSLLEASGGPMGWTVLAIDIATWTTWDTSYTVRQGQGPLPLQPVPTPP